MCIRDSVVSVIAQNGHQIVLSTDLVGVYQFKYFMLSRITHEWSPLHNYLNRGVRPRHYRLSWSETNYLTKCHKPLNPRDFDMR